MKILKVGDTTKVACNHCQSFEYATFKLRSVPFSDGSGVVNNVLAGVCDKCDNVTVIPNQSTPVIKKQLEIQRRSIESRVPAHMVDILNLASYEISGSIDFVPNLVKFYVHAISVNEIALTDSPLDILKSEIVKGKSQKRISIKGKKIANDVEKLKQIFNINKTSDLLKIIISKIYDDVLVKKDNKQISNLRHIFAATA
jgi:hypothetical protein